MVYYRWQNLDRLPKQGGLLLVLFSGYERSYPKIIKFREKKNFTGPFLFIFAHNSE